MTMYKGISSVLLEVFFVFRTSSSCKDRKQGSQNARNLSLQTDSDGAMWRRSRIFDLSPAAIPPPVPEFAAEGFTFRGWGSGGQGFDRKSGRSARKASASVRERLHTFASAGFRC